MERNKMSQEVPQLVLTLFNVVFFYGSIITSIAIICDTIRLWIKMKYGEK